MLAIISLCKPINITNVDNSETCGPLLGIVCYTSPFGLPIVFDILVLNHHVLGLACSHACSEATIHIRDDLLNLCFPACPSLAPNLASFALSMIRSMIHLATLALVAHPKLTSLQQSVLASLTSSSCWKETRFHRPRGRRLRPRSLQSL